MVAMLNIATARVLAAQTYTLTEFTMILNLREAIKSKFGTLFKNYGGELLQKQRVKVVNYFWKNTPSQVFDTVLNTPLVINYPQDFPTFIFNFPVECIPCFCELI